MKNAKFEDVFREGLADLYDAENQIVAALPKLIAASSSEELAEALQEHLDETKEQVKRLDKVFQMMGEQPAGKTCEGMQGLLKEGERIISENEKSPVLDAGIIAAAQKVEHYEIASYGTARSMAEMLGQSEVADLLQETLEEEEAADENLTEIAADIMGGTGLGEGDEEEEIEEEEIEEEA
ncbi:MAG: ferritin-like domain-containing protein [Acidobacteriia bacterium]|nr:ferritin-like domain-containing protein [Terriglobia bacterium]